MTKTIEFTGRVIELPPQIVDDLTRREFLIGAGLIALAPYGCGGDGEGAGDAAGDTRTIEHAAGTTEVPGDPRRVVAMDNMVLDNMLALGEKPIAYATSDFYRNDGFASYLGERVEGIEAIEGSQQEPDLEVVAGQEPDLILGYVGVHEGIYDQLSEIAPTVLMNGGNLDWKADLRLVGETFGKVEEAEGLLREYEERAREIGGRIADSGRIEVSLVSPGEEQVVIYLPDSYSGQILQDVGLARPQPQIELAREGERGIPISEERLGAADGDVMFLMRFPGGEGDVVRRWVKEENALWNNLGVVKRGEVYEVDGEYWTGGRGITASNLVLDDIEERLLR